MVERFASEPRVDRVWFIGSHGRDRTIALIDHSIEAGGFRLVTKLGDRGAWLHEFVRVGRPLATA